MYHFDYVGKHGGAVFENYKDGSMVFVNDKKSFSFDDFLNIFVLIEQYKHPFTITTTIKRQEKLDKQLEKIGYVPIVIEQLDFDFGEENAFIYGYYHVNSSNPFQYM